MDYELYGATIRKVKDDILAELQLKNFQKISITAIGTSIIKAIAFDPSGNGKGLLGGAGSKLVKTTDYGLTYGSAISHGVFTGVITGLAYSTITANLVMGIDDGGVIGLSTDGGDTWTGIANSHGGSALYVIRCDASGKFHFLGASGKYSQTTDATGTACTSLINAQFGTIIIDNMYIGSDFMMLSGHSKKISRSTDGGATWTSITNPGAADDAYWCCSGTGNTVVVGVYEGTNKGKILISNDKGLTFAAPIVTKFSELSVSPIRLEYYNGIWTMIGNADSNSISMLCYSFDLVHWTRVDSHPFGGQIIFKIVRNGYGWSAVAGNGVYAKSLNF